MANAKKRKYGNVILDSMPDSEYQAFLDQLDRVEVGIRQVVHEPGRPVNIIYFPVTAVFSTVAVTDDGGTVEVATVGREGLAGLSAFLGKPQNTLTVFSQIPGTCWQVPVPPFRKALEDGGWLHETLHHYTQCLMVQMSQSVICNARHTVLERCARWLLMSADRVQSSEFLLTQEFLGQMLAARRGSVNETATTFESKGLIEYSRGRIKIVNRKGLEGVSCECYERIASEYKKFAKDIRHLRKR
ncbi:MAG: Crp/Fnr family transcriptional regulator [Terriglobia bacterium]